MIEKNISLKVMLGQAFIIFFVAPLMALLLPSSVYAADTCPGSGSFFGLPTWYQYLPRDGECSILPERYGANDVTENPINIGATAGAVVLALIEIMLWVAGVVAIGFVVYGGIQYTLSQGIPEKLQAARKTMLNSVVGLIIAALAVAVVNLVSNIITG